MQDRKLHPLEDKLLGLFRDEFIEDQKTRSSDQEKNLLLKTYLLEIKECKDVPPPDINVRDTVLDQDTALTWAAHSGSPECVKTLISAGANKNAQNAKGNTALHWAAYKKNIDCMTILLAPGIDVTIKNKQENTAIDELFETLLDSTHTSLVRRLLEHGCLPNRHAQAIIQYLDKQKHINTNSYYSLAILCNHYENSRDLNYVCPIMQEDYQHARHILSTTPVPQPVIELGNQLSPLIDTGIDTQANYPQVLVNIIRGYDNTYNHLGLFPSGDQIVAAYRDKKPMRHTLRR